MSCSEEDACLAVSIDDVFLGREGTEPCYYARNRGETTGGWCGVAPESCVRPGGRVRRRDTGGIVDEPDRGSAAGAGPDEGLAVGTDDGAGHAEGLADELVEKKRPDGGRERRSGGGENRRDETSRGGRRQAGAGDE